MKRSIYYILISAISLTVFSCGEPAPVELISDIDSGNDKLDIEILSPTPNVINYSNGYDSTGIVGIPPNREAFISISGIKTTYKNLNIKNTYNAAIFSNLNEPIKEPSGRLLGFKSYDIGIVKFDGYRAHILNRKAKFRIGGNERDTTLGFFYVFNGRMGMPGGRYDFPYNSKMDFKLERNSGEVVSFDIPTPEEISGKIKLNGSKERRNLSIDLNWEKSLRGRIEIIIGAAAKNNLSEILPLVRIKIRDNGFLRIPNNLLKNFPADKFDVMTISICRIYEYSNRSGITDELIYSKSIHNIMFDVP